MTVQSCRSQPLNPSHFYACQRKKNGFKGKNSKALLCRLFYSVIKLQHNFAVLINYSALLQCYLAVFLYYRAFNWLGESFIC